MKIKLFFFLLLGGYIFSMMLNKLLSINDTILYFFIFYMFFFDAIISSLNFKKVVKIFSKNYMFLPHEKIIRLLYGRYVFKMMLNEPLYIDTILYFFIFYMFLFDTIEVIKENISSSNFKKVKIFSKNYMFLPHEKIIRIIKPIPLSLLFFFVMNIFIGKEPYNFVSLSLIFFLYVMITNLQKLKTSIKNYMFPPSVEASLRDAYPLLTKRQREKVLEYLRLFFIDKLSNVSLNTPSLVLNRAWKAFSLSDEYESFSYQLFNRDFLLYIPILKNNTGTIELPNKEMDFMGIWKSQCRVEKIDPFFPQKVPSMFMLDEALNIADGIKFQIDEAALREVLSIKDAPSPNQLINEIEEGNSQAYLAKKLQYYLGNKAYCKLYQKEELQNLLKKIQKSECFSKMVFGAYTDVKFFIENVLENSAPPSEACSSPGVSV